MEIPGVHLQGWGILPAGTYVFRMQNSEGSRHVVQIFNKEETQIYATILAIANEKLKAADGTVMTFHERPAGQPPAIRAWFYPGRTIGEEFVYQKAKAMEIAKATETPVPFTPKETPVEVTEPIKQPEAPVVARMQEEPVFTATPQGKVEPIVAPQIAAVVEPQTLPVTASPVPLMGLFGFLALGGAFALRTIEKHLR